MCRGALQNAGCPGRPSAKGVPSPPPSLHHGALEKVGNNDLVPAKCPESPSCWAISPNGAALGAQFQKPPVFPGASLQVWRLVPCVGLGTDWRKSAASPRLTSPGRNGLVVGSQLPPRDGMARALYLGWVSSSLGPHCCSLAVPSPWLAPPALGAPCLLVEGHGTWK